MIRTFGVLAHATRVLCLAGIALAVGPTLSVAAETPKPSLTAVLASEPPQIDGRLNEAVWQTAAVIDGLQQKIPVAYGEPTEHTEVRVLYDADFLYIGVHAFDSSPNEITLSTMVRDADMSSSDRITISLDTYFDQRNGFHFEVNPLGNKRDGLIENGSESYEWDGIWYADARIDATGYYVEIAIPYKTLSIARDQATWGLQVVRYIKRKGEEDRWASPTPEIQPFNLKGAGRLDGLIGIQQGIGLDVVPKLALRHSDDGLTGDKDTNFDPGVDAFYRITPSLTGALTVNTDFGEAEVDTRQINLTRFSLFFPEKRQFFLQDGGIFSFGGLQRNPLPFFSRRIGFSNQGEEIPIFAGTKVTGRIGQFNVGLIDVVTDDYKRLADPATGKREKIGVRNLTVARVSANVLDESTAGVIVTNGNPNSKDDNFLIGADVNYRNSQFFDEGRTVVARSWVQRSDTEGLSGDQLAWGTRLTYPNDRVNWYLIAEGVQKNFNPALGFTSRRDIRNYYAGYRFRQRPSGFLRTIDHRVTGFYVTNTGNEFRSGEINFEPFTVTNPVGDNLAVTYARVFETLPEDFGIRTEGRHGETVTIPKGSYSWDRYRLDVSASDVRPISARAIVTRSGFHGGERWDFTPSVSWRPSRHFLLTVNYTRNQVDLPDGDFVVHLIGFTTDIQFTTDLSWNTFVQFDSDSDTIGINTRVRWIITPGREFFAVLNQGLLIEDGELERGVTEPRVKLGWTFRF